MRSQRRSARASWPTSGRSILIARPEVGELARAERRGDRLLERDDGDAFERTHQGDSPRTTAACPARARRRTRGSGWSRSAPPDTAASRGTCARRRIRPRSRSRRGICRQTFAASHDASAASSFAMFASAPHGWCASNSAHASKRIRFAASTFDVARARSETARPGSGRSAGRTRRARWRTRRPCR